MVAVDANIILELIENRSRAAEVQNVIAYYANDGEGFAVSTLSVGHVFYLAEAHKVSMKRVEELVQQYKLYDVVAADVEWALLHYKGKDFEDALQIAAALREKCAVFLTIDALLARKYSKFLDIKLIGKP
jgi:predicted nucleic acid-binding protein